MFVYGLQDAIVDEGEAHKITFIVRGIPQPYVTLTKNDVNISFTTERVDNGIR